MAVEWPVGKFPPYGEIPIGNADRRDQEILDGLAGILTPEAMELVQRLHRDGVWTSGDHTAVDVPIMATGPGAERVSGRMDNTDVFEVMRKAMER